MLKACGQRASTLGRGTFNHLSHIPMKFSFLSTVLSLFIAINLSAQEAKAPAPLEVSEFTLKPSAAWTAKEATGMKKGIFSYLKDGKPLMDADIFCFGEGQGGDVASNVNRWEKQFQTGVDGKPAKAVMEIVKYGEAKAVMVEIKGTYLSGPMMGEKTPVAGQTLVGAIMESTKGSVFIKMVGKDADVVAAKAEFRKMIDSAYAVPGVVEKAKDAAATK
jgi:hypothetical protein